MEITRNVILDLLPLYLANEVSADTRALIEKYLETDPEFADDVKRSTAMELREDIPIPLTREHKLKAYSKAKWLMFLYVVISVVLVSCTLIALLAAFFFSS